MSLAVGAGHAREQKGAGIGAFLFPERQFLPNGRLGRPHGGFMVPELKVARMAASYMAIQFRIIIPILVE